MGAALAVRGGLEGTPSLSAQLPPRTFDHQARVAAAIALAVEDRPAADWGKPASMIGSTTWCLIRDSYSQSEQGRGDDVG